MLKTVIHYCCSSVLLLCLYSNVSAQTYKWVDDEGQVHFSQTPPNDRDADIVKTQKGPKSTPQQSQQAVDQLIYQQGNTDYQRAQQREVADMEKRQKEQNAENCKRAKANLQQYLDNPGGRVRLADGSVKRLDENERQQRIRESRDKIEQFCK